MKVIERVTLCALIFCLACLAGCSENKRQDHSNKAVKSDETSSKLQLFHADLTNAAACVIACTIPLDDYLKKLENSLHELSQPEREMAFHFAEEAFSRPKLKSFPLTDRQKSVRTYKWIVKNIAVSFSDKLEDQAKVWQFLLRTISIFDRERDIVSAPEFDPHTPLYGLHMTKGMYADAMDSEKFEAIQNGFEQNISFTRYYHRLSAEQQKEWIARLEKVAGRKVVIYNPDNPAHEPPKRPFAIPSYLPPQVQEQYREIRRNALRKAGAEVEIK